MSKKKLGTSVTGDSVVFFLLTLISIRLSRGLSALELYVKTSADLLLSLETVFCRNYIPLSMER